MRILIAEDDHISSKVLGAFFKSYGECTFASDGAEAFELFQRGWESLAPFEIVCLDITMPKLSGIEVLTLIREFERQNQLSEDEHANVLMVTGQGDSATFLDALAHGSTWFVTKPIERAALENAMKDLGFDKK